MFVYLYVYFGIRARSLIWLLSSKFQKYLLELLYIDITKTNLRVVLQAVL